MITSVQQGVTNLYRVTPAHLTYPTADEYIAREMRRLGQTGKKRKVLAATADSGIQLSALGYGANVMTTRRLVTELKRSRAGAAAALTEFNERQRRRSGREPTLRDALDKSMHISRGAEGVWARKLKEAEVYREQQQEPTWLKPKAARRRRQGGAGKAGSEAPAPP